MTAKFRGRWVPIAALTCSSVLAGGCVSADSESTATPPPTASPSATSSVPETVIPARPRVPPQDYFVEEVDEAVADTVGRRFVYDASASAHDIGVVMVRVSRDAPPDEIIVDAAEPVLAAVAASWEDWGKDATVDVVRCPFDAGQLDTVDVYLRSLKWRDPDKDMKGEEALRSVSGPKLWDLPYTLDAFVNCQLWFGVRDITLSEIERIREVAMANDISWMEFAITTPLLTGPSLDDEPRDPPAGFLPHFELPWYCSPPACTGDEEELDGT